MIPSSNERKWLIFRLSSFGDVILATAALEALPEGVRADWVVAPEFAAALEGHPRVARVIRFDRKLGFAGWRTLCRELANHDYAQVLDLHASLRTRLAWVFFRAERNLVAWRRLRKDRWQLWGYFALKRFWPKVLRPKPLTRRHAQLAGGSGEEKPNLRFLAGTRDELPPELAKCTRYICVMPGSRWPGKKWPTQFYFQAIRELGVMAVVLGRPSDQESVELLQLLAGAKLPSYSGISARPSLRETATLLAHSIGCLGNDTGMGHLSEAVGRPAYTIFGPTRADLGFGPWRPESRALARDIFCSPCGKTGRFCIRIDRPYACLRDLAPSTVAASLREAAPS